MHDWLGISSFLQTMIRIGVVWIAFFGVGKLLEKPLQIRRFIPMMPPEITGMIAFFLLTIPLSLLGVMNRTVCSILVLVSAMPGAFILYGTLKEKIRKPGVLATVLLVALAFAILLNFTYASMPNLAFDDPLITYAHQPDRWLNAGRVFWLEETTFSAFPLFYEMTAVWPASLSVDRMNQLSILQVYQMSLLILAAIRGLRILRIRGNLALTVLLLILVNTNLFNWCAMAKTDTMAILFCTLALAAAIRQREKDFSGSPLSSWLFMGIAMASKQTSLVVLLPFLLYSSGDFLKYSWKRRILALVVLGLLPAAFGIRTMLKTGSPTYPFSPVQSMLKDGWERHVPEENIAINSRSSDVYSSRDFSMSKHIGVFFAFMEGCVLLLLAGTVTSLLTGRWRDSQLFIPFLAYSAAAIYLFWPPWWGAKYSILIYPFTALLGAYLLRDLKCRTLVASLVFLPSFIIPGFIAVAGDARPFAYRWTVMRSVLTGDWFTEDGYKMIVSTPEGMTHLWANSAFSSETVIFSIREEKRYFFDGTVIVGWRHPLGQRLYMENSLETEMDILDSLGVDIVAFYRNDPAFFSQEDRLEILDHIGTGDILEPVIMVNGGYLLCRYDRTALY